MTYFKFQYYLLFLMVSAAFFAQNKGVENFIRLEIDKSYNDIQNKKELQKAYTFFKAKNYDSTLIYSMKHLYVKDANTLLNDYCHYFRGYCFKHKKLYNAAIKEFQWMSNKNSFYKEIVNLNKGEIAIEQSDFKNGLRCFLELEKIQPLQYVNPSYVYGNIGICYIHLKKYEKASSFLFKSLKEFEQEKDTVALVQTYTNLANMYYDQYKDALAIPYFKKAYEIAHQTKDLVQKNMTAANMAIVAENNGNLEKAISFLKESQKWRDLLNDQNKIWAVAEAEKKFAIQQKQKQIRLLQIENQLKIAERNNSLTALVLLLILFGAGIYFYLQKSKTNKIILSQKEVLNELNATKDKLFSIISHDLRSSVSSLKTSNIKLLGYLESKNYEELDTLLHRNSILANSTYNLLDNLLNWSQQQTNQLYFEKESLHLYTVVEQVLFNYKPLLFEKNITLTTNISKELYLYMDLDSLKIILRNIIDNAIKFSKSNGFISIYTEKRESQLVHLIVEDTGIGMDKETVAELTKDTQLLSRKENKEIIGTGLGLQLCKVMLQKNDGKLAMESKEGIGTKMILILPEYKNDASN